MLTISAEWTQHGIRGCEHSRTDNTDCYHVNTTFRVTIFPEPVSSVNIKEKSDSLRHMNTCEVCNLNKVHCNIIRKRNVEVKQCINKHIFYIYFHFNFLMYT